MCKKLLLVIVLNSIVVLIWYILGAFYPERQRKPSPLGEG